MHKLAPTTNRKEPTHRSATTLGKLTHESPPRGKEVAAHDKKAMSCYQIGVQSHQMNVDVAGMELIYYSINQITVGSKLCTLDRVSITRSEFPTSRSRWLPLNHIFTSPSSGYSLTLALLINVHEKKDKKGKWKRHQKKKIDF